MEIVKERERKKKDAGEQKRRARARVFFSRLGHDGRPVPVVVGHVRKGVGDGELLGGRDGRQGEGTGKVGGGGGEGGGDERRLR